MAFTLPELELSPPSFQALLDLLAAEHAREVLELQEELERSQQSVAEMVGEVSRLRSGGDCVPSRTSLAKSRESRESRERTASGGRREPPFFFN